MEDTLEKQILQQQLDYQQTAQKFFKLGFKDAYGKSRSVFFLVG